ncbi:MAG: DUF4845 domain-containing protein [Panacagrimonas sp.]
MSLRIPARQRGIGWVGLLFVLGALAFVAIVVIKVGPLYLNQMTVERIVKRVAEDPEMATADPLTIRDALQRGWDADYVDQLKPRDIKIKRTERGRTLIYDYEARVHLFYNIFVVVEFAGQEPMRNSGTAPY